VDYIFRWLGSRFLSPDEKASLGLIDRSAVVDEAPGFGGFGAGLSEPAAPGAARTPQATFTDAPQPAAAPAPTTEEPQPEAQPVDDKPQATAVAAEPAPSVPEELTVIATNRHANGVAANGNGNGHANGGSAAAPITLTLGQTKVSFQTQADAPSCADCGSIMVRNGSCYKCLNCGSTSGCS
jgi:ribonucleoside-diphosphate reductase alpha chain